MKDALAAGITHTHKFMVPVEKTVPRLYPESALFREMPEVFATGYLVGFIGRGLGGGGTLERRSATGRIPSRNGRQAAIR